MQITSILATAAIALLASVAPQADAHSFLKTPVSRETSSRTDVDGTMGCP
ncbi:Dead/deah box RNA helicase, partial [Globisporangium polare]